MLLITLALLAVQSDAKPVPPLDRFSPRDLYVSCSLLLSENGLKDGKIGETFKPQDPATCLIAQMKIAASFRGKDKDADMRFCPNGSVDFDNGAVDALSRAYLNYFEANAIALRKVSGWAALAIALRHTWPCD